MELEHLSRGAKAAEVEQRDGGLVLSDLILDPLGGDPGGHELQVRILGDELLQAHVHEVLELAGDHLDRLSHRPQSTP